MKHIGIHLAAVLAALFALGTAHAQVSGTMNVQLTLQNGCIVSGSGDPLNAVDFGTMDFGTAPTLFAINLQSQSRIAGNLVQLQCSSGTALNIQVGDGQNSAGGVRQLASGGNLVQYRLYTQAAGAGTEYTVGGAPLDVSAAIPGGGGTFNLPIFGLIAPQAGLVAGTYTDLVSITLTF